MTTLDIGELLDTALRAKPERGDDRLPHVSDLFGCDRATWARRSGKPQLPFSARTLVKFEMGHAVEAMVADAIVALHPGAIRNERIAWNPVTGRCIPLADDETPTDGFIVGHTDLDLPDGPLLEIKSTSFYMGREPKEADRHYVEQACAYATARGKERFGIVVVDRSSGKMLTFWFNTAEHADWARKRAVEVLVNTDPSNPIEPAPNPRTDWACRTCRWAGCALNKNPERNA
jgi:hypothetical protein